MSLSGFRRGKQARESISMNSLGKESGTNLRSVAATSGLTAESFYDSLYVSPHQIRLISLSTAARPLIFITEVSYCTFNAIGLENKWIYFTNLRSSSHSCLVTFCCLIPSCRPLTRLVYVTYVAYYSAHAANNMTINIMRHCNM
jgi:hypothetical protein